MLYVYILLCIATLFSAYKIMDFYFADDEERMQRISAMSPEDRAAWMESKELSGLNEIPAQRNDHLIVGPDAEACVVLPNA